MNAFIFSFMTWHRIDTTVHEKNYFANTLFLRIPALQYADYPKYIMIYFS